MSNEVLQARSLHSRFCSSFTLWTNDCKMHVVDFPPFLEWENWKYKTFKQQHATDQEISQFLSGIKLLFHIRKQDRRTCFAFVAHKYSFFSQLPIYEVTFPSASNPPGSPELVSRKPLLLTCYLSKGKNSKVRIYKPSHHL